MMAVAPVSVVKARSTREGVELDWAHGPAQRLQRFWLRDNCPCPDCLHGETRERIFDILEAAEDLRAAEVDVEPDDRLRVIWEPGGHVSVYSTQWLASFRQDTGMAATRGIATWEAADLPAPPAVDHRAFMEEESALAQWLRYLLDKGVALLTDAPRREGAVLDTARRIGPPRDTNFGLIFDVRSKPNPNNNAYTALGLAAHVDLPNWERPPDYQLLYCLENTCRGGDSFLVDGFRVAEVLRAEAPEDFFILSETPVDFRFHDETQDIAHRAPIIGLDATGRFREIRFNMWLMDAVRLPETQISAFYRAYRRLARLLREQRFEMRLRLTPGQMLAFDNRRILHGRTAFDPNSGARHLQGTYLDRDLVMSRLRVLQGKSPPVAAG